MDFAPLIALETALYAYKAALLTNQSNEVIRERLEALRVTIDDAIAQYPESSEKSDNQII